MNFFKKWYKRFDWAYNTPQREKNTQIKIALDTVMLDREEGGALLRRAMDGGMTVGFKTSLIGTRVAALFTSDNQLLLNPDFTGDSRINSIFHELKHFAQEEAMRQRDLSIFMPLSSARDDLIFTRVLEADAHAYADLAVDRVKALRAGKTLDNRDQMEKKFLKHLSDLALYDTAGIRAYHKRNTSPGLPFFRAGNALRYEHVPGIADMRAILHTGGDVSTPRYMQDGSNLRFAAQVFNCAATEVRRSCRLMIRFEKAVKRYPALTPAQSEQSRWKIHKSVRVVVKKQKFRDKFAGKKVSMDGSGWRRKKPGPSSGTAP